MKKIRVLVVDDSALVRKILSRELNGVQGIEVVATAPDPFIARDKLVTLRPDVVTLDIEMPRMDGLTFLKKIMRYFPTPVVIVSSLTSKSCALTLKALELGAVDVIAKPGGSSFSVGELRYELAEKIRVAAMVDLKVRKPILKDKIFKTKVDLSSYNLSEDIVAIGASTGGTEAIKSIFKRLPKDFPPLVIVQHMPPVFTSSFAERLNDISQMEVYEARGGEQLIRGVAYLAPGNFHMTVKRVGAKFYVDVKTGPRVNYQRPSVDILFQSVARHAGQNAIGVLLTGMGSDGALGLLKMKDAGSHTIVQNEESCVVYGMPGEAVKLGAAEYIEHLNDIPDTLLKILQSNESKSQ